MLRMKCRSGKHRSVGVAELLARAFDQAGFTVYVLHQSLQDHWQRAHNGCQQCEAPGDRDTPEDIVEACRRMWDAAA